MLMLRILTLPIAMLTFAALSSAAIKMPATVEFVSVILWLTLPAILIGKIGLKLLNIKGKI